MNEQWIILGQLLLAALLGGVIGLERETRHKEAGVRTHALIAFGSALFSLIALHAVKDFATKGIPMDGARILSEIVSGVGFISAGVIIFRGDRIRGLTTAAGLWVCAALGMAIAVEWYIIAVASTAIIAFIMHVLSPLFVEKTEEAVVMTLAGKKPTKKSSKKRS